MENTPEINFKDMPSLENAPAKEIAEAAATALDSKKAKDIKILHVEDKTVIAEYFVLCTGTSSTHIKALADETEYLLGQRGLLPYRVEGRDNNSWWILDYSNVLVHIFSREAREFYNLDKLYAEDKKHADREASK